MPRYASVILAAWLAAPGWAATDLTVDAVTRATTLNPSVGEVAALTDGRTPDQDPEAPAFSWSSIGLLAVGWPSPVHVATLRIYVGQMQRYAVYGYLGGSYTDTGQRLDVETPVYSKEGIVPLDANGWYEIPLPADQAVDNLGLQLIGSATLYEFQFLGPDGTAVQATSFGIVKKRFSE